MRKHGRKNRSAPNAEKKGTENPFASPTDKLPIKTVLDKPEVLDKLPQELRLSVIEAASFSGPLPPPSMYRGYDEVLPGSAERILAMAEKEQNHRIGWENDALKASVRDTGRGQWFGLIIAMVCIGASTFLAINGHHAVAGILGGVSAITLVGHFIQRKKK